MEEPEKLFDYFNRLTPVTTRMTIQRWLNGKNFPTRSKRPSIARAIGCTHQALEDFLNGILEESAFFSSLPDVPDEYRRTPLTVTIDVSLEDQVFKGVIDLFSYLSKARTHQLFAWLQQQVAEDCLGSGELGKSNAAELTRSTDESGVLLNGSRSKECAVMPMRAQEQSRKSVDLAAIPLNTEKIALFLELLDIPTEQLERLSQLHKAQRGQ
jgi:hypothetical protein